MTATRRTVPFLGNGPNPNHVQLLHLQRPRRVREPCDNCGELFNDKPTHWRVRANISPKSGGHEAVVGHYCGEECARFEYAALMVEIALITGKKVTWRELLHNQVGQQPGDSGMAVGPTGHQSSPISGNDE